MFYSARKKSTLQLLPCQISFGNSKRFASVVTVFRTSIHVAQQASATVRKPKCQLPKDRVGMLLGESLYILMEKPSKDYGPSERSVYLLIYWVISGIRNKCPGNLLCKL